MWLSKDCVDVFIQLKSMYFMCTQQSRIEFNGLDEDIALSYFKVFEVQGSEILNIDLWH